MRSWIPVLLTVLLLFTGCSETATSSSIAAETSEPILFVPDETQSPAAQEQPSADAQKYDMLPGWDGTLFAQSSLLFNKDLAVLCADFSEYAYDTARMKKRLDELDFDAYETYNYSANDSLGTYRGENCFVIAHATLDVSGEQTAVLCVFCRGTDSLGEKIGDWLKGNPYNNQRRLGEYRVWQNIYDFYTDVKKGLNDYRWKHPEITDATRMKVLLTGHSLGGAAANLCGAAFDLSVGGEDWWSDRIRKSDIFVYTYGAIKTTVSDHITAEGFENIHNIYNYYDVFLPTGYYGNLGVSSMYSVFGHFDYYQDERFHDEEYGVYIGDEMPRFSYANHDIKKNYFRAMSYEHDVGGLLKYGCLNNVPVDPTLEPVTPVPSDSARVPDGTYVQYIYGYPVNSFTFYGDHRVSMNALGIAGDGTYVIKDGVITIEYCTNISNTPCVWRASFSMRGDSIFIDGDELIRED